MRQLSADGKFSYPFKSLLRGLISFPNTEFLLDTIPFWPHRNDIADDNAIAVGERVLKNERARRTR